MNKGERGEKRTGRQNGKTMKKKREKHKLMR